MAQNLAEVLSSHPAISFQHPFEINEVFACMPKPLAKMLTDKGIQFYCWSQKSDCYRFVTSFQSTESDVNMVGKTLNSKEAKDLT
ncbi:MAG: hypothetical protein HRU09_01295 [Oligoflexales bacterium]|nr:hypothetical protein [Oligoflexales bacterium]